MVEQAGALRHRVLANRADVRGWQRPAHFRLPACAIFRDRLPAGFPADLPDNVPADLPDGFPAGSGAGCPVSASAWSGTNVCISRGVRRYPVDGGRGGSSNGTRCTSWYGIVEIRWAIMLTRARRLSSLSTIYHGDSGMSVCRNISAFAREYSSQRLIDSRSIGDSFHRLMGSCNRERNRSSCSLSLTENKYLRSRMPSSISSRSKIGHWCRKRMYSSLLQKPITRSTPARLYQLRSNSTISPAAGKCWIYRWKYHWLRSRSVGAGSAAIRARRGLRYSLTRLTVLPLPAASRPSKTTTTRAPSARTHSCSLTSSPCNRNSSAS